MVKAYINGTGCISPQNSIDSEWFFDDVNPAKGDYFDAIEPSYKEFIAPNLLRRMGRAIKMGVAAGNIAIQQADVKKVDAIITGTGLGCFEDSERFLLAILNNDEQFLTPTSFIQSTHNTVGSQIALIMKCHDYNFTYVHRGFSFESTLQDALMLFAEGKETILIGGIEEHTPNFIILNRKAHKFQVQNPDNPIWKSTTPGIQLSEGTAFFVLNKTKTEKSIARVDGIQTLYKPKTSDDIWNKLQAFLKLHDLTLSDIDVTLMGFSGDVNFDSKLQELLPAIEKESVAACYKNICGEYHTASAFAMWTGTKLIEKQSLPKALAISDKSPSRIKHVLIMNQYLGINYSFMLLSQC
ncbi:MAG: 3-oxoacyl-ACP synthase [Bacteroidetes bacterium]|nr:3-oxoacyl-ACP synthase [Bacteroidota bacterium]MDF2451102.1 3-oxoacyl-ACP synthase [Bacteroidota bacterium]